MVRPSFRAKIVRMTEQYRDGLIMRPDFANASMAEISAFVLAAEPEMEAVHGLPGETRDKGAASR
jgi:hypothetical protein